MKGAAGMVGMMRVSRLAHRLEDLLVELRAGSRQTTPELTDSMLLVVDGLSRLVLSPSSAEQDASLEGLEASGKLRGWVVLLRADSKRAVRVVDTTGTQFVISRKGEVTSLNPEP